jgi:NAD(P)-dependent dehydrogenase (short-subunit alcohol dehydrogenase family)
MRRLANKRVLVVGASAGIGRAVATCLRAEGARLAVAARRQQRLVELAAELGGDTLPLCCDVRDPATCESAVAQAVRGLGGLDALVYTVGVAPLRAVRDADHADWRAAFESNVVGASLVTRAALGALTESRGRAVYLSSIAADDHPPRSGLGLYATTKAALNKLVELWQHENRTVSFTRVSVGDTGATEMALGWDPVAGGEYVQEWIAKGLLFGRAMEPEVVGRHVADLLAARESVPVSSITPRFPVD